MEERVKLDGLVTNGEGYLVSNLGNVKNRHGKLLKLNKNSEGYIIVNLWNNGNRKPYRVHRLVALAFLPNPDNLSLVNHKDKCKTNNKLSNLEWCNAKYNLEHGGNLKNLKLAHCKEVHDRITEKVRKPIKVYKYPSMEFVAEFDSGKEASEVLGINASNISKVVKKKYKQTGGYYFELAN